MILGIVGSEAAKFTTATEAAARAVIRELLATGKYAGVVSGRCHLGGVDLFAIDEAQRAALATREFPPRTRAWLTGYKPRNIQIATFADEVVCITVRELPPGYTGMRFALCYHCGTKDHVKSGGCWTVKYAQQLGKRAWVVAVS